MEVQGEECACMQMRGSQERLGSLQALRGDCMCMHYASSPPTARLQPAYSPPTARRHLLLAPRVDGTHRASGVSEINSDGDTHLVG